jgi:hypothetical protein
MKISHQHVITECHGRVVNILALYSGGPEFKSQPGDWLSWLRSFAVFLSPSRQMLGYYLKLYHDCFLPNPFQFIIHLSSFHSTLHSLRYWNSVENKLQIYKLRIILESWKSRYRIFSYSFASIVNVVLWSLTHLVKKPTLRFCNMLGTCFSSIYCINTSTMTLEMVDPISVPVSML